MAEDEAGKRLKKLEEDMKRALSLIDRLSRGVAEMSREIQGEFEKLEARIKKLEDRT